ncbi:MAG: BTAD domain-containing putative transcriptional regulator [Gaiellaceae bacterium]
MDFRLLGGLEVWDGEQQLPLGGGKQRAVLALLLLHANEVLATDRLIDELWGESPPETARTALQVYVVRLRKALGADRIRTHEPGYVLELAPDQLDVTRFERLVQEARELRAAGEDARAAQVLSEALALWRGPPLADFTYQPFARTEIARLEELRLTALEERIDADLALGHRSDLVGELEALVAEHPYRERLRGQLMLALYRAGRQADALALYQETRRLLVDELGIEPGPALQRLESAILRQEPALETVLEEPAAEAPPPDTAEPDRRLRWRLGATIVGLLLVAALVSLGLSRRGGRDFLPRVDANAVGVIDAEAAAIEAQVDLPGRPGAIAAGGGFVWAASESEGTVSRVDPDRQGVRTLEVGESANGVAYGGGAVWVTIGEEREVVQINPDTIGIVQTIAVGNGPGAVAVGEGAVWVANTIDGTLSRIELASGDVKTIPVGPGPAGIAVGARSVWVTSEATGSVLRLDPRTGAVVQSIGVGNGPTGIAVGEDGVWVANRQDGTVSRIDPATNSVSATIPDVGMNPTAVAAGLGAVWVANAGDGTIARIDPTAGSVAERIEVDSSPNAIALAGESAWTTTLPSLTEHRGGVLRVESVPLMCACIDPAAVLPYPEGQIVVPLAYDTLLTYRRVAGIAGTALVGNLALRVPTPTDRGRTYTLQLRPGIRYSDGTPVRASDFRFSVERALTLDPELEVYDVIEGAAECGATPSERCDLSRGIKVDDALGRITIRLTRPDPDFVYKLTFPFASVVPADTPLRVVRSEPIPSTGPYQIAVYDPARELRLVRNPHFRVWSTDARPDGYPDEIRVHLSEDVDAQVTSVEQGRGDVMLGPPVEQLQGLLTQYPGRLHSDAVPWTDFMFLNTREPPFDDLRVRQALNYAVDRERMVELLGGPLAARATCQLLPPDVPGYRPYCPSTLSPNPGGTWTAPDLAKAKALVAASGTEGMRVEVVAYELFRRLEFGRYFVSLLRRLGYQSSLRAIPELFPDYLEYVGDSRNRAQIGTFGWYADFASAALFLRDLFACASFLPEDAANRNLSAFCEPGIDVRMTRAAELQASDPVEANTLWAEADRALVDRAAAVPLVNRHVVGFVSERVGNYQLHPQWLTLLDQLWVR